MIFTGPSVLEIVVALVVEHLVRCQIHSGVEELRVKDKVSIVYVHRYVLVTSHREPRE